MHLPSAVYWCWVTAHLYEHHIFIGVIAVTQNSPEQWGVHFALSPAAVPRQRGLLYSLSETYQPACLQLCALDLRRPTFTERVAVLFTLPSLSSAALWQPSLQDLLEVRLHTSINARP